ncbi:spore coat protein D [Neobacillus niacini]|uniref:CotD family spore coat protein n=1 Tax=Neobacillus niacini TaxID=86668 RepID=UPI002860B7EF|nr:CotD family spore coat protein [Neobacillus niacini]MDR7075331.1 spore coat protein D [Neobacillus niacini]
MYLGTNFAPPVIHPTQQFVNHTFSTTVVPHIHPKHMTTINHHLFQHKHYCPQSASCVQENCNQHIDCCCPGGMPGPAPMAVAGAQSNALPLGNNMPPNMGPGMMGPGMGPGMMGPGMGPGMAPGQYPRPRRFWR